MMDPNGEADHRINKIRIGSRASQLALAQANLLAQALREHCPALETEIVTMLTSGDRKSGNAEIAHDKRDWIYELEQSVIAGELDCAIHSGKDIPAEINSETLLCPVLPREEPWDAFVLKPNLTQEETQSETELQAFPLGAVVGTGSLRRKAQLLRLRPDLQVVPLAGNVPTRIRKLAEDPCLFAIVLAAAGLRRLGLEEEISAIFSPDEMLPAVNQGILAVQYRASASGLAEVFARLVHSETRICFDAERAFISVLGADCKSSVGVMAVISEQGLKVKARVLSADGRECLEDVLCGPISAPEDLGTELAYRLLERGAKRLL